MKKDLPSLAHWLLKKRRAEILGGFLCCLLLTSTPQAAPVKIVTSFSILGDMVKTICGEHGDVTSIVGPDSDAHTYEPKPTDAKVLLEANLIFINGFHFERWFTRLIKAIEIKTPIVIATQGLIPLPSSKTDRTPDPHAWNSLENAPLYIENIKKALIAHDGAHREIYEKNAKKMIEELASLATWAREQFSKIPQEKRHVVTAHDAFHYLGKDFGISFHSPAGIDTKSEPSARTIARLIQRIRSENISAIFVENITNATIIEQIAGETGIEIGGTLYSDALSKPNGPAPTYLKLMRHNITQIADAMRKTLSRQNGSAAPQTVR